MAGKFDRSIFIVKFKEETDERLVNLSKGLLALEVNPNDEGVINEIFREAHTLKGSAKMVGLSLINQIAHKMEDLLGRIKERRLEVRREVIDILLRCVDYINELLNAALRKEEPEVDVEAVCEELEKALQGEFPSARKVAEPKEEGVKETEPVAESEREVEEKMKDEKVGKEIEPSTDKGKETPEGPLHEDKEATKKPILVEETVRVGIGRLDELMGLIGEMVINKAGMRRVFYGLKEIEDLCISADFSLEEIKSRISGNGLAKGLEKSEAIYQKMRNKIETSLLRCDELTSQLEGITNDLEYMVIKMRMLPVSTLFDFFPRLIRDLAMEIGKDVEVELKGQQTGLDKKILEEIKEPLIHIIRNCIDHGIEDSKTRLAAGKPAKGRITLSAFQEGSYVNVMVEDDGVGIDVERIKTAAVKKKLITPSEIEEMSDKKAIYLIFTPGFSTKTGITDISGRGVGMDVVKDHVENLKGTVVIETEKGKGTSVTLKMPLTLATTQAIIIKTAQETMAVPTGAIEEIVNVSPLEIKMVGEREVMVLKRRLIPLLKLNDVLGLRTDIGLKKENKTVIIINLIEQRVGFMVDKLVSQEEIVVKGLGEYLRGVKHVAGATILGGGEVAVILNPADLIVSAKGFTIAGVEKETKRFQAPHILVVDDSYTTRELEKTILESFGYEVETSVDGVDALEKIKKKTFDLVLTDVQMPKMNGFELTVAMKRNEKFQGVPVIILTSLEKEEEKRKGIEAGADAYLVKSAFDQTTLLETIEQLIG